MIEIRRGASNMDFATIVPVIQASYWGQGRTADGIIRSAEGSVCIGLFEDNVQIGFARAVSDGVYFAYIFDVFVLPDHRGRGLGRRLIEELMSDEALCDVTGWMLATRDAHDLYRKYGFEDVEEGRYMGLSRPLP